MVMLLNIEQDQVHQCTKQEHPVLTDRDTSTSCDSHVVINDQTTELSNHVEWKHGQL